MSAGLNLLTGVAAIGSATVGGVFYGFSTFIMRGLRQLPTASGTAAMQQINLTAVKPGLMTAMFGTAAACAAVSQGFRRVSDLLLECDYLSEPESSFEPAFRVATADQWQARYRGWIQDPVRQQTYLVRTLFDLRAISGDRSLWTNVESAVTGAVDRDFVHVLANDCLASLPPLTFYQDAVIDGGGERHATFQLGHSALQPLVDVGRVFGIAGGSTLGRSTLERFAVRARALFRNIES